MNLIQVDRYTINISDISYLITESKKEMQIFFKGRETPLVLHGNIAIQFIEKYNSITNVN